MPGTDQADVKELAAMNVDCVVASRRLCVGQTDAQKRPDIAQTADPSAWCVPALTLTLSMSLLSLSFPFFPYPSRQGQTSVSPGRPAAVGHMHLVLHHMKEHTHSPPPSLCPTFISLPFIFSPLVSFTVWLAHNFASQIECLDISTGKQDKNTD